MAAPASAAPPDRGLDDRAAWFLAWAGRLAVLVVASLPAAGAARGALAAGPARAPWYVDAGRPLPAVQLGRLLSELAPAVAGAVVAGVLLAWVGQQLVTAGAIAALDPDRRAPAWRAFTAGGRYLGAFARAALVVLVPLALGGAGIAAAARAAPTAAASADVRVVLLPAAAGAAGLVWAALCAALGLHLRIHVVLSGDRAVRRALLPTLRLWRDRPWTGPGLYVALVLGSATLGAWTLAGWRQSGGAVPWRVATVAGLALQSAAWVAVLRESVRAARGRR